MLINAVAPFAGAWIEIVKEYNGQRVVTSLPSRERGVKCAYDSWNDSIKESLPSRERGLKWRNNVQYSRAHGVAPFAGAWIEMMKRKTRTENHFRRSLRGSVD